MPLGRKKRGKMRYKEKQQFRLKPREKDFKGLLGNLSGRKKVCMWRRVWRPLISQMLDGMNKCPPSPPWSYHGSLFRPLSLQASHHLGEKSDPMAMLGPRCLWRGLRLGELLESLLYLRYFFMNLPLQTYTCLL